MEKQFDNLDELIERHRRGEKVVITNVAIFPSDIFPVGSTQTLRMYTGRTDSNWGTLIKEIKVKIGKKSLEIPPYDLHNVVNPATGKVKHMWLSYWIVRPEGIEQYAGFQAELLEGQTPSLDSLLTTDEFIN